MDKTTKFLKKLNPKERLLLEKLIKLVLAGKVEGLDIKRLKGFDDIFRARSGDIRIMYRKVPKDIKIIEISRRSEKTYRKF